jgi:hypothetical protein
VQYSPYGRQLFRVSSVLSHEGGAYRLFDLTPGYYYVSARYSAQSLQLWNSMLELSPNLMNPDDGYATVFYPGEMKTDDAKMINLRRVREVANADIVFKETQYFKLSITLTPPAAEPLPGIPIGGRLLPNSKVAVFPVGIDLGAALDYRVSGNGTKFSVDRLAEGDYVLVAFADVPGATGNAESMVVSDTQRIHIAGDAQAAIAEMDPIQIPGNVTMGARPSLLAGTQVQLVRVDPSANETFVAKVDPSGHFMLSNVGPGIYDVFLKSLPRNAYVYVQSAGFANSTDRQSVQIRIDANLPPRSWKCLDGPCDKPVLVSDSLMISYSPNGAAANGTVTKREGGKAEGAEIVLVPNDPISRLRRDRYGIAYSDASGRFQIQGIPAGSYMAYAFQRLEPDIYYDRDFNLQIASKGIPVNIGALAATPITLSLITADDVASVTR